MERQLRCLLKNFNTASKPQKEDSSQRQEQRDSPEEGLFVLPPLNQGKFVEKDESEKGQGGGEESVEGDSRANREAKRRESEKREVTVKSIGVIRSCFPKRTGTPKQGRLVPSSRALITLSPGKALSSSFCVILSCWIPHSLIMSLTMLLFDAHFILSFRCRRWLSRGY